MKYKKSSMVGVMVLLLLLVGGVVAYMMLKPKSKSTFKNKMRSEKVTEPDPDLCFACCGPMNALERTEYVLTGICPNAEVCCGDKTFINNHGQIVNVGCQVGCCNTDTTCVKNNTPCPSGTYANNDGDCCAVGQGINSRGGCCPLDTIGCCRPEDVGKTCGYPICHICPPVLNKYGVTNTKDIMNEINKGNLSHAMLVKYGVKNPHEAMKELLAVMPK